MPAVLRFRTALLAACSITLAFWLAYALHVERPYWAGVAAMVLSQSAEGQSLQKGLWRMAATVVGAAAGMAVLAHFGESRAALLAAFGGLLAVLVMLMRGSAYSYFYYSTALMAVLVGAQSHEEAPFAIASARIAENLVGIAAYTLCALCLRPQAASREIGELPGFGRGVLDELRDSLVPAVLLDKLRAGLQALAALALVTAVWQWLYPPGTAGSLFAEIGALLVLLGFLTGGFDPRLLLASFAAGVGAALALYVLVMPALSGFAELGAVIFAFSFGMAWVLPRPEQGMARMGLLLPVFVLSGMGGEHFTPQGLLSGAAGLMSAAFTVSAVFMLAGAGGGHTPAFPGGETDSSGLGAGAEGTGSASVPLAFVAGVSVAEGDAPASTPKEATHAA